jgi:hypothetical protein
MTTQGARTSPARLTSRLPLLESEAEALSGRFPSTKFHK